MPKTKEIKLNPRPAKTKPRRHLLSTNRARKSVSRAVLSPTRRWAAGRTASIIHGCGRGACARAHQDRPAAAITRHEWREKAGWWRRGASSPRREETYTCGATPGPGPGRPAARGDATRQRHRQDLDSDLPTPFSGGRILSARRPLLQAGPPAPQVVPLDRSRAARTRRASGPARPISTCRLSAQAPAGVLRGTDARHAGTWAHRSPRRLPTLLLLVEWRRLLCTLLFVCFRFRWEQRRDLQLREQEPASLQGSIPSVRCTPTLSGRNSLTPNVHASRNCARYGGSTTGRAGGNSAPTCAQAGD